MNDPEAIRFVNEVVRPLAEKLRAVKAELNSARISWYAGLNTKFATGADPVDDGRDAEGVSRLTCGDVTNFIAQAIKTAAAEGSEWNEQIIAKPCVRAITVS